MSINTQTLIQEVYFDLCDVINGSSYKTLGYDNKIDFLLAQRDKLSAIENNLYAQINQETTQSCNL
jgi:hypothetical protein